MILGDEHAGELGYPVGVSWGERAQVSLLARRDMKLGRIGWGEKFAISSKLPHRPKKTLLIPEAKLKTEQETGRKEI